METIANSEKRAIAAAKKQQIDASAKLHLLQAIDSEGFEEYSYFNKCETVAEKCSFIKGRFESEYQWRVDQVGQLNALTDWLQGLALNIEYMNYSILEMAVAWGSLPEVHTESQADKILENYWRFMANKLSQLMRKGKI